jgi:hypothetical protein
MTVIGVETRMAEDSILEFKNCKGEISYRGLSLGIEFHLSCARDGRISILPQRVPLSNESKFLLDLEGSQSRLVEEFTIAGYHEEGVRIESEHAYLSRCTVPSDKYGAYFDLEISANRLNLSWEEREAGGPPAALRVEYFVPGLRCFGLASAEASFGRVSVAGSTNLTNYSELSGVVAVDVSCSETSPAAQQLEAIDAGVRRLLQVLSLADGRFMQWSIRRLLSGGQLRSALFHGPMPSLEPRFPLFSYLNLDPIVSLAVERCTEELCENSGIDVAIEWFLMHPPYTEAELLTGMTALEHLIHVFVNRNPQGGIFSSNTFKRVVRPRLKAALDEVFQTLPQDTVSHPEEAQEVMSQRLGGLNQRTLQTNLQTLLTHYVVPVLEIKEEIPSLIKLRNEIVHRGHGAENTLPRSLSYYTAVLRELLSRVFLSLLQYKGEYQSYLKGPQWKQFPPTEA